MTFSKTLSAASALTMLLGVACDTDSNSAPADVVISGQAYDKVSNEAVAGATVSIAEYPELTTTTDTGGAWLLSVPSGVSVTPVIVATGYVTTHTQTFQTADADIDDVHFQILTPEIFGAFAAMLSVTPDPAKCQISTEVTDLVAQELTLDLLLSERPHGVEGASVTLSPPGGAITYFIYDEPFDLPDAQLDATTTSGGLVSTQVDPGVYTISATHPTRALSSITVTCEAGRFINATVPHGIRELPTE